MRKINLLLQYDVATANLSDTKGRGVLGGLTRFGVPIKDFLVEGEESLVLLENLLVGLLAHGVVEIVGGTSRASLEDLPEYLRYRVHLVEVDVRVLLVVGTHAGGVVDSSLLRI